MRKSIVILLLAGMATGGSRALAGDLKVITANKAGVRELYAAEYLRRNATEAVKAMPGDVKVTLQIEGDAAKKGKVSKEGNAVKKGDVSKGSGAAKEAFKITSDGKGRITVSGSDGSGVIYGCVELAAQLRKGKVEAKTEQKPEMVLRGACIGLQKTAYLPGHTVYEYPYTPENFPWFYDKKQWIEYLDMLVENRMNSLYLWNGHPFASLVRLKDYPFAVEVDDETFKKNEEMFAFLTEEANKRGIYVIQMFYNIILSKPFADHYGLKTQDRNRPITPLISDYTRKSVAAFIEKYPNVGLLVCLGEAMATYEDDVDWFVNTIIPGVKDGLKALGRTDEPPILLRAHDTDCKMVMEAALPLYKNLYTMHKYNGESLTTYQPRGPWTKIHQDLAALGSTHIENVHILANLEPWRWSSPDFVLKTVNAMHNIHHANALHLYPQASYWDWPYTADKIADNGATENPPASASTSSASAGSASSASGSSVSTVSASGSSVSTVSASTYTDNISHVEKHDGVMRERQLYRDKMWYALWGRYAWNCRRDSLEEAKYWNAYIADRFGLSEGDADNVRRAYEESGEIAPKLLRRFGITEGNRQTLLLGMFVSQLVNPYKYTIYPGFYESCGPEGEKLIEYVEKEWKKEAHKGELPLDIVEQTMRGGDKAVEYIMAVAGKATKEKAEFQRLVNDMLCYREFARSFGWKVRAAQHVLNYKWGKDINELDIAATLLEKSLEHYRNLVSYTKDTYWYANSMQTAQRRIPIGGDDGKMKTWQELLPRYELELANLRKNTKMLRAIAKGEYKENKAEYKPLRNADVKIANSGAGAWKTVALAPGVRPFEDLDSTITALAPELQGLKAIVVNGKQQRADGTQLTFSTAKPIKLLVGYFRDDQMKYAKAPKLETDATANDYGQAEPAYTAAVKINGMPQVNVHTYSFAAGNHTLLLPKGYLLLLGATSDEVKPRDVALSGNDEAIDWLFY